MMWILFSQKFIFNTIYAATLTDNLWYVLVVHDIPQHTVYCTEQLSLSLMHMFAPSTSGQAVWTKSL